jgi:hypothetical protein
MKVQDNQQRLKLNRIHQILEHTSDIKKLNKNIGIIEARRLVKK